MSKLEIVIEDNKLPIIKRFDKDLKIGERKTTLEGLVSAFFNYSSVDTIFSLLIERSDEFETYFQQVDGISPRAADFLCSILENIGQIYINSEHATEALNVLLEHLESSDIDTETFLNMVSIYLMKFNEDDVTVELLDWFKKCLIHITSKVRKDVAENVHNGLASIYKDMIANHVKQEPLAWVEQAMDLVPLSTIVDYANNRTSSRFKSDRKKLIYQTIKLPSKSSLAVSTSEGMTYFYDIPKSKICVKYHSSRYTDVGHPRLLFAIYTNKEGLVQSLKVAALKGKDPLTSSTKLFHYPFSNVYSSGSVCWSGYHDLDIDTIPMMFLSAPNNSHLNDNTLELFKKLENKNFNDKLLTSRLEILEDWY
jgi:hypothetical protein